MRPLPLTLSITLYANALACQINDDQLDLLAAIFTQLGDTLATISTQRSQQSSCKNDDIDDIKEETPTTQNKDTKDNDDSPSSTT